MGYTTRATRACRVVVKALTHHTTRRHRLDPGHLWNPRKSANMNKDLPPKLESINDAILDLYSEPMKGTGCCLHITTDDFNIEDHSVDFCIEYAKEQIAKGNDKYDRTHEDCLEIAKRIRALSKRERAILLHLKWCPKCEDFDPYGECYDCGGKLIPIPYAE